ncbi:hypothetical protein [Halalkalibacter okhensis]|uniref:Cell shape determination protein CcmA n=1 Tax=Halalkalibacter okhensis TaxID=333138 RepID=A0A0B0IEA4_9BACI|nr:hypothetical protein [Halalkalibacter okhensis]KHF38011.1 hypothetical protein LQ50_23985 [Halalkalibacter okhensis]
MNMISTNGQEEDMVIECDTLLTGTFNGNLTVLPGAKLCLDALLHGDLYLKKNSIVTIQSTIVGNIYNEGARVELMGLVEGEMIEV